MPSFTLEKPTYPIGDILSISDFTKEQIRAFIDLVYQIKKEPPLGVLKGKILGSCFFEPSTRTRLSFEAAMKRLGGDVIGFSEQGTTSHKKGETLFDAMKIMGSYVDVIVIRHPSEGSARLAAEAASIPVINGGDGANQHPTQTLIDLFSIHEAKGKLRGLNLAIYGDLKGARTAHSLAQAAALFDMKMYFVSPKGFEMPEEVCSYLKRKGIAFSFHHDIREVLDYADVLYVNRMQKERHKEAVSSLPVINYKLLKNYQNKELKVFHALPRVEELATDLDATPFCSYFDQAANGVPVRQALLISVLRGGF